MCIRVGAKDLSSNSRESHLGTHQSLAFSRNLILTMKAQRKLRKVQTPFKQSSSPQDTEESFGFVRQKRTVRLVTSHWETQHHSDDEWCQYCTNLAQFNTRPRFLCFQNQSAKAVCKTLLHDTKTSSMDLTRTLDSMCKSFRITIKRMQHISRWATEATYSLLIWERWRKRAMSAPGVWRTPSRIKIS